MKLSIPGAVSLRRAILPLTAAVLAVGAVPAGLTGAASAQADGATPAIVDSTRHDGKYVSLTFDDGPDPVSTPKLLAVLKKHQVKATFCLWGDHVKQHPDIVREIAAAGHVLCNHTMHHDNMGTWTADAIKADLIETSAAIREAVPDAKIDYFRAPYGSWGKSPEVAAELGMQPLGWQLTVSDWEPPGTPELVRRIREGIRPGGVVLLHDGGGDRTQTVEAVDQVVPELKSEGWKFEKPARRG